MTAVPAAAITAAAEVLGNVPESTTIREDAAAILAAALPHLDGCIGELSKQASDLATENIRIATELRDARRRTGQLEQLARDILDTFGKSDAGYRARVGQVQIGKWRAVLDGQEAR